MNFEEYIYTFNLKELSELLLQSSQKDRFQYQQINNDVYLICGVKTQDCKMWKIFPEVNDEVNLKALRVIALEAYRNGFLKPHIPKPVKSKQK
ncbi:MAG TPA: hypothetical protein PLK24_02595 [Atribacter sp.]|jgi:hypothetical protein|uniref:hypothetical protein n=1 Tax=Atribacter sp. TaxID=2847780 RepID=UPI002B78C9A1|nr:hypothetical protein [Atribacter sp.]MDI9595115.1 hypothetical protein [Atribacterota bacterium]HQK82807.1 hypothetical protein [Atribacter sp.]